MSENWFLKQCRSEAENIVANAQMNSSVKRDLLGLIAARIEGFSLNLPAQPELFRECCNCRDEMHKLRGNLHWNQP